MEEYKDQGLMSPSWNIVSSDESLYFISHQSVLREHKHEAQDGVRLAKTDNGRFNDILLPGSNLQNNLLHLML